MQSKAERLFLYLLISEDLRRFEKAWRSVPTPIETNIAWNIKVRPWKEN